MAKYRWAALAGDLAAALIGVSLALVARFGAQINLGYFLLGAVLPIAWLACVALERGYETRYFGTGPEEFRSIIRAAVALTARGRDHVVRDQDRGRSWFRRPGGADDVSGGDVRAAGCCTAASPGGGSPAGACAGCSLSDATIR